MVTKPAHCIHCGHAFEYDTHTAKSGKFRYILVCPKCGKENRPLKEAPGVALEAAGAFLGIFLVSYFLFHESPFPSIIYAIAVAAAAGLAGYQFRVRPS